MRNDLVHIETKSVPVKEKYHSHENVPVSCAIVNKGLVITDVTEKHGMHAVVSPPFISRARAKERSLDDGITRDLRILSSWDLPESICRKYADIGIVQMFDWQVQCLLTGRALDGGMLLSCQFGILHVFCHW